MKKTILALLPLLFLSVITMAQLQKGTVLLGGALNYSTQSGDQTFFGDFDSSVSNFTFSPKAGIFLKDNLALGLNVIYNTNTSAYYSSGNGGNNIDEKSSTFGLGPFVRMYFPVGEQIAFFGQFDLSFQSGDREVNYQNQNAQDTSLKNSTFQASTALGFSFFPKKWVSLDLSVNPLSYRHVVSEQTQTGGGSTNTNALDFGLNTSSILLGAHFFINKK